VAFSVSKHQRHEPRDDTTKGTPLWCNRRDRQTHSRGPGNRWFVCKCSFLILSSFELAEYRLGSNVLRSNFVEGQAKHQATHGSRHHHCDSRARRFCRESHCAVTQCRYCHLLNVAGGAEVSDSAHRRSSRSGREAFLAMQLGHTIISRHLGSPRRQRGSSRSYIPAPARFYHSRHWFLVPSKCPTNPERCVRRRYFHASERRVCGGHDSEYAD
jgi:hypothetical protein